MIFFVPESLSVEARAKARELYEADVGRQSRSVWGSLRQLTAFVRPLGVFVPKQLPRSRGWRARDWNLALVGVAATAVAINTVCNLGHDLIMHVPSPIPHRVHITSSFSTHSRHSIGTQFNLAIGSASSGSGGRYTCRLSCRSSFGHYMREANDSLVMPRVMTKRRRRSNKPTSWSSEDLYSQICSATCFSGS